MYSILDHHVHEQAQTHETTQLQQTHCFECSDLGH